VIPRTTKFPQRRYGGSLRCTTNPHRQGFDGRDECRDASSSGGISSGGGGHNVGRSNSFRFNRPRNSFTSASSSGLNSLGMGGGGGSIPDQRHMGGANIHTSKLSGGSSGNLLCKHIKYCCLHQQQHAHPPLQKNLPPHSSNCMAQQQQQLFQQQHQQQHHQQQPSIHFGQQKSYHHQQQQQQHDYSSSNSNPVTNTGNNTGSGLGGAGIGVGMAHATSSTRLGPDGEDNTSGPLNNGVSNCLGNGQHSQQSSKQQQQPQKRHSIILERAFDFDASCDESDTISTTSSTPTTANVPYNVLKPILKQPQQSQHQVVTGATVPSSTTTASHQVIVQQSTTTTIQPKSILKDNSQQHHLQQHQQQQQQMQLQHQHRSLPQPPKNAGPGAFHTKETALQRIQQQSGLLQGSRTNLANLGAANPLGHTNHHYNASAYGGGMFGGGGGGVGGMGMGVGPRSCSTFNITSIGNNNATGAGAGGGSGFNSMTSNNNNGTFASGSGYMDLHSPSHHGFGSGKLSETLLNTHTNSLSTSSTRTNLQSIRTQKSPILNRRRSSSIVANLLTADFSYNRNAANSSSAASGVGAVAAVGGGQQQQPIIQSQANNVASSNNDATNISSLSHSNTRDRIALVKSPVTHSKPARMNLIPVDSGGVLTFQQAMSGAVSPQYSATSPLYGRGDGGMGIACGTNNSHLTSSAVGGAGPGGGAADGRGGPTTSELDMLLEDTTSTVSPTSTICGNGGVGPPSNGPFLADTPTDMECNGLRHRNDHRHDMFNATTNSANDAGRGGGCCLDDLDSPTAIPHERIAGVGSSLVHGGSSATIAQLGNKQRQRMRTSSMPAESRKPRLADTRRQAIHCADLDLEYYRLRSFSITSHGVCNLGDSLRSRRSRSINSVTSTGTSNSGKDRHNSNASRASADIIFESDKIVTATSGVIGSGPGGIGGKAQIPVYKIAMLGASGVGKTTLTYQFTTSDYICAYDLSLDDDYGQKTVSVLVDGIETDLEIIDHPACEMSAEAFCSTYNIDLFVVVYSVVDRNSFKQAERILQYLKENEMLLTRGAILVGNKTDLERHREVNRQMGRKVAKDIACKFIETSSGLDHNVDELLVGIVAQVKLNPQRLRNLSEKDRQRLNLQNAIQKHRRLYAPPRRMVRQMSMCQAEDEDTGQDENQSNNIMGDEGIGTGSERTASTSLSSASTTKTGPVRKPNKRTLNLESILKMGESELEDEEEAQRMAASANYGYPKPLSKFELLTGGSGGGVGNKSGNVRTPFGSVNSSPKSRKSYDSSSGIGSSKGMSHDTAQHYGETQAEDSLLNDCNRKTVSKLTSRTKVFLSSVLRFKKAINVAKRRNSSSCSDLFVI
uniref:Ras family protein n=1 Tax=Musca domestica TaxID=7370 RepID=A0A1I8NFP6_MUSDO